ncbi:MAG: hypothetical protein IJ172_05565, partial [Ruminococcus sp.]|nr:hypothetical protein [Ruminococcus sp.]
ARFRLTEDTSASNEPVSFQKPSNKFEYTVIRDDESENVTKQTAPTNLDVTDEEVGAIDLSDLSEFLDDDDDKY